MALILKGRQAEVKISVTATFPDTTDTFTAVFKRGNVPEFKDTYANRDKITESEMLNKWLIRLEDLEDAETGKTVTVDAETILPIILDDRAYSSALVIAAWKAIGNVGEIENQRVGNSTRSATHGQAAATPLA